MQKKAKSLGRRIAVRTTAPLALILAALVVFMMLGIQSVISELKLREINEQTDAALQIVESYFEPFCATDRFLGNLDLVESVFRDGMTYGTDLRYENDPKAQELLTLLVAQHEALGDQVQSLWICGFGNKEMMTSTHYYSAPGLEPKDRPWYQELVSGENDVVVSSAYVDMECNEVVVSVMHGVYVDGTLAGVVAVDVFLDEMLAAMDNVSIGDTGSVIVCDSAGSIVYSKNREEIMNSIYAHSYPETMKMALYAKSNTPASEKYKEEDASYYSAVTYSEILGWRLIGTMPNEEFIKEAWTLGIPLFWAAILSVIGTFVICSLTGKSIAKPAQELSAALMRMGNGDLRINLEQKYVCEFAEIKTASQLVLDSLTRTLSEISMSASQVDNGTNQISEAAQALAQGTTEQASAVEELATTIGVLSEQTADGSKVAEQLKTDIEGVNTNLVDLSDEQMKTLLVAMTDISEKSEEIGKIIKTISDIAFQTNILALNAAVEAARAGAYGKGFSVVADEVRNLASKCDLAAKDITELIQDSTLAVTKGVTLATDTAKTLDQAVFTMDSASKAMEDLVSRCY